MLVAALIGGVAAGVFAIVLSCHGRVVGLHAAALCLVVRSPAKPSRVGLFMAASALIVWVAGQYRSLVRRLDEEEAYRKVVVDELGHRVKNKLATIYAILRHELRGHDDIWESVSGRLRALSAADDFLVKSDGKGVELRQILEMELEPYGSGQDLLAGRTGLAVCQSADRIGAGVPRTRHQRRQIRRPVGIERTPDDLLARTAATVLKSNGWRAAGPP